MKVQSKILAAMFAAGVIAGTAQAATVTVTNDVVSNKTWLNSNTYVLNDPIYVTGGATLTIQPGTLIRSSTSTGAGDAPGALVVARDGTINANGTATQPIVFTDMTDDNFVGPTPVAGTAPYNQPNNFIGGAWGGVVILGNTYLAHNVAEVQIEGLEVSAKGQYGGSDDGDSSGSFTFVSIRHGGHVIGTSNELNGLTMGAVGRGTKIQNIEVYQTLDDGFEWFGGTVDTKHLVSWSFGDDGFDWDEGFRGRGQFWLAVKGLCKKDGSATYDTSDSGAEMDGAGGTDDMTPASLPTIYNATFVGHGPNSTNSSYAGTKDLCWQFRDGTGGRYVNSMVLDFGGALALIEGNLTSGKTYDPSYKTQQLYTKDGSYTHQVDGLNKLDVRNSVFWGVNYADAKACSNGVTSGEFSASGYWGGDKDNFDNLGAENGYSLLDGTKMNVELPRAYEPTPPIMGLMRATTAVNGIFPVTYLDPTVIDERYMNAKMQPPADQYDDARFYSPVAFQGAFGGYNWAAWMNVAKLGLMPDDNYGVYDYLGSGSTNVNMQITKVGNLVSFELDPSVHEGYVCDIYIFYRLSGVVYSYNFANGVWDAGKMRPKTGALRKFKLDNILDVTGIPAGTVINFTADQTPDGANGGNPRFGLKTLTL